MFHEKRNVVAPFAQRRQLNRNHIQTVEQIFAKRAGRDHPGEVRVRRGDHAHIHLDCLIVADALELPLLQGAQQLHLQRRARGSDFIQKERSLVCLLESTLSCSGCAGKRTSDVTEQLCFEQRFRDRAELQRDPGNAARSRAVRSVRGAFTGATATREGRFEQAHKGTLFLDEIGTTSPALQMKLLRALQEREFERVGDNQTIKVDVRVIAATNSDLTRMVAAGTFREDLFYRLNVIPIQLPPLRERRDDIPLLVKHFLTKFSADTAVHTSQSAMRALMAYHWPGNVRQLENAMERAVALCSGRQEITVADLPTEVQSVPESETLSFVDFPDEGLDMPKYLASVERDLIHRALDRTQGNRNKAADLLRIKRTTLVEKLKRIGAPH